MIGAVVHLNIEAKQPVGIHPRMEVLYDKTKWMEL